MQSDSIKLIRPYNAHLLQYLYQIITYYNIHLR